MPGVTRARSRKKVKGGAQEPTRATEEEERAVEQMAPQEATSAQGGTSEGETGKVTEMEETEPSMTPVQRSEEQEPEEATPTSETVPTDGGASAHDAGPSEEGANQEGIGTGLGWVIWNGERFEFDVVVHADGHVSRRDKGLSKGKKKKYGHTPLTRKELSLLEDEGAEVMIIGTGQSSGMPLTPKAEKWLDDYQYFIGATPEALRRLSMEKRKVAAILHVTC